MSGIARDDPPLRSAAQAGLRCQSRGICARPSLVAPGLHAAAYHLVPVLDLAALIDHLSLSPAHVLGNSLGGVIALRLAVAQAASYPQLVWFMTPRSSECSASRVRMN